MSVYSKDEKYFDDKFLETCGLLCSKVLRISRDSVRTDVDKIVVLNAHLQYFSSLCSCALFFCYSLHDLMHKAF
jgi:hypothetical protein